jgi:hypothetical protein
MAMRIMILCMLRRDNPKKVKRIIVIWSQHKIIKWPVMLLRVIAILILVIAVKGMIRTIVTTMASTVTIQNWKLTRQYLINNLQGRIKVTNSRFRKKKKNRADHLSNNSLNSLWSDYSETKKVNGDLNYRIKIRLQWRISMKH